MFTKLTLKGHPVVADTVITFDNGFNLLTAPNGRGKSTVLEMLAYSLFGTPALRGNLEDFPNLETQLLFTVRGKNLRVTRSRREHILHEGETPLVSGATPVNAAIVKLLGYGLKVYNVANHIKQGQVNALTDRLRAEDRRQVLENTVGLTVIDKVISELNKTLLETQAEWKANTAIHVEPIRPEFPPTFLPVEVRTEKLNRAKNLVLEYHSLRAKRVTLKEPAKPSGIILDSEGLDKLRQEVTAWRTRKAEVTQKLAQQKRLMVARDALVLRFPSLPNTLSKETLLTMADIDKQIALLEFKLTALPKPMLTQAEIDNDRRVSQVHRLALRFNELCQHKVTCPNCEHSFVPNQDEELQAVIGQLEQLVTPDDLQTIVMGQVPAKGNYSEAFLLAEERRLELLPERVKVETELQTLLKTFVPDYKTQLGALEKYERDLAEYERTSQRMTEIMQELDELGNLDFDSLYCQQLENALTYQESLIAGQATYEAKLARFEEDKASNAKIEAQMATFYGCEEALAQLEGDVKVSEHYDYQLQAHQREQAKFETRATLIVELEAEVEDYKLAVNGLKETKKQIKSFLLPSLNKAASALVSMMTEGTIRSVQMLDDFSVKADSKRVELFSGSEQAVINIALRVALGQVLTHKVFGVVIGDELDASMDVNRTALLWRALNNLVKSGSVGQLILVSHEAEPIEVANLKEIRFT